MRLSRLMDRSKPFAYRQESAGLSLIEPAREHAEVAGLVYVTDEMPGIRRKRAGKGFSYIDPNGGIVRDPRVLARIKSLAIPPAYSNVWICARANGHLQATGRDERGRKQYRYHPNWRDVRDLDKFDRMLRFAEVLPSIRQRIDADMALPGMPREKVLAVVVSLLDRTLIRIGNAEYKRANDSFGLTTLHDDHVDVRGAEVKFEFRGKSGKNWQLRVKDRRIARIVRGIQELPGQALFQFKGDDGKLHAVESQDVNQYLREISGEEISSKDFRTWAGTVLAAVELSAAGPFSTQRESKTRIRKAIARVSQTLGNTVAVCRKCYVHPAIIECYLSQDMPAFSGAHEVTLDEPSAMRETCERIVRRHLERILVRST